MPCADQCRATQRENTYRIADERFFHEELLSMAVQADVYSVPEQPREMMHMVVELANTAEAKFAALTK